MKKYFVLIFILCFVLSVQAQETTDSESYKIIRSNVGAGGSSNSVSTPKGKYTVSQSIGQSSVIGTYSGKGYYLRQGYQQPSEKIKIVDAFYNNSLKAIVYPNPFELSVSISFNETITKDISITLFDIHGKLVYSKLFSSSQNIQLELEDISQGTYILKALSNDKVFNTKIIKI